WGGPDDTFGVGVPCAADGGCSGTVACAPGAPSAATTCAAFPVLPYWQDVDRDGFGGADAGWSCAPDAGWVRVPGDCDDTRSWIHPDAGEVCDQLDDDCNGVTDDLGGARCDRFQVPGLTAPQSSSSGPRLAVAGVGRVVAVGGDGGVAYVESDGGVLSRNGVCPGDWYGAWVNPANDRVFLGGPTGSLAALDRTGGCTPQASSTSFVFGLWGLPDGGPSPMVNVVDTAAHYATWVLGGAVTSYGVQISPCCGNLRSLTGRPGGAMMASGWLFDTVQRHARVLRSPGQGQPFADTRVEDVLVDAGFAATQAALHDVTYPRDDLAYAVGESSMFVQWDGGAWALLPPVNATRSFINSVVAFDEQHVYLATGNFILRWDGAQYSAVVFAPNTIFSMVRGTSPADLWAVANGQVWHFSDGAP
ncbi:MAG TPA: putative metal-binding motif-containing protein, partial [Myxococcales bacterium]|nr:putative metal-binding motif-containing protein [Myxococcales bacterium]